MLRIVFLARQSLPFSPQDIHSRRVGGSEIALYYVAKGLAGLGHDVVVLNHCGEAGVYDGVRYLDLKRDYTRWRAEVRSRPADVLVLFRRMLDVVTDIPARVRVFWAHDYQGVHVSAPPSLGRSLAIGWRQATGPLFHKRVDRIFVVSKFMRELFVWLFRTPPEKVMVMPNGVDTSLFAGPLPEKNPHKFVYTSVPERGLAQLLREIFPEIRKTHSDAELHVASYQPLDEYRRYGGDGIRFLGRLREKDLAKLLLESSLLLYPANVEEMGAIAVLEAMAAGTPAVTSSLGVLPELAGEGERGIVVPGRPGSQDFARRFVEATLELLADRDRLERMRSAARDYVFAHHDWNRIVQRWDETLRAMG